MKNIPNPPRPEFEPRYSVMGIMCDSKEEVEKWKKRGKRLVLLGFIAFILFIVVVDIIIQNHGG